MGAGAARAGLCAGTQGGGCRVTPCVLQESSPNPSCWHSCLDENKAHTASWQGCAHNSSRAPLCEAGKGEKSDTCPLVTQAGNRELASSAVGQVVKSSPEDSPGEAVRSVFQQLCHRSASLHQEGPWRAPGHGGTASLLSSGSSQQSPSQIMASIELSSKKC